MTDDDTPRPEFSVCQFFEDGSYEYVCRFEMPEYAMKLFFNMTRSLGARIGTTVRVIVTDGGDCTNAEWKHGEGYTYPPNLVEMSQNEKAQKANTGF